MLLIKDVIFHINFCEGTNLLKLKRKHGLKITFQFDSGEGGTPTSRTVSAKYGVSPMLTSPPASPLSPTASDADLVRIYLNFNKGMTFKI